MPDDEYVTRLLPFLERRGVQGAAPERVRAALPAVRERARTFIEAADKLDFFFRDPPEMDPAAAAKFLVPENAENLRALAALLESVDDAGFVEAPLEAHVNAWLATQALTIQAVAQPARVALSGRTASPGLFQVMELLGKKVTVERLASAARVAEAAAPKEPRT